MENNNSFFNLSTSFQDICIIYPPLNRDIGIIGYENFIIYSGLLTESNEDLYLKLNSDCSKDILVPPPFIFLLTQAQLMPLLAIQIKKAFKFFIHEDIKILFDTCEIVIGDYTERRIINSDNFFEFQNLVRNAIGQPIEEDTSNLNPRARRFKMLAKKRDLIKMTSSPNKMNNFSSLLTSVCCIGCGLNPSNIGDITYAATKQIFYRYIEKENYETKLAISMINIDSKNKDNLHWTRDI